MNATPSQLVGFLARLRLQSRLFQISDSQFLAAHQLIGGLAGDSSWDAQWPPGNAEWCALLGPVLCSSEVDLAQFQEEFDRYFQSPGPDIADSPSSSAPKRAHRKKWLSTAVAALAISAIAVGVVFFHKPAPHPGPSLEQGGVGRATTRPRGYGRLIVTVRDPEGFPIVGALVKFLGQFKTTGAGGTVDVLTYLEPHYVLVTHPKFQTNVVAIPGDISRQDVTLQPGVATASASKAQPNWVGNHALELYATTTAIPLLAFLFWLWRLLRKALELRRKITPAQERMQQIGFDQASGNLFRGADVRRLATGLRRRRFEESDDLAAEATAEATARAAGYFTPVFARRQTEPEYLAILEQKNSRDHQTRLQDELFSRLRDHDVAIRRFYFQNDPSVCFDADHQVFSLSELAARHPSQELWVSCEANKCVNPVTGRMQQWTQALTYWRDRVLLSALAVEPMVAIAAEIRAAAPTRGGLESLTSDAPAVEHVSSAPEMFLEHPEDWLDPTDPGSHRFSSLSLHLRRYLGWNGYLCLQACAIYPEIAWNITASAAAALVPEDEIETVLERISMLPWMRHGFMPEWFRIGLVKTLGSNEQKARDWLETYLAGGAPGEQRAEALNVVPASEESGTGKSVLPEPDRDRVYLWFASGKRLEDLSASAPRTWFKLMIAPLMRRVGAVLTATTTVAAAACFAITFLSRTPVAEGKPAPPPGRPPTSFVAAMVDVAYGLSPQKGSGIASVALYMRVASDILNIRNPVPAGDDPKTFLAASERAGAAKVGVSYGLDSGYVAIGTKKAGLIRQVTSEGIFVFGDLRPLRAEDFDLGFLNFNFLHPITIGPDAETSPVLSGEPAGWDDSPGPDAAWCYQESTTVGNFGAYCHWSEANCKTARSAAATACVYVKGLRKAPWRPAPKGIFDSWWEYPMTSPLPLPFPQLTGSGSVSVTQQNAPPRKSAQRAFVMPRKIQEPSRGITDAGDAPDLGTTTNAAGGVNLPPLVTSPPAAPEGKSPAGPQQSGTQVSQVLLPPGGLTASVGGGGAVQNATTSAAPGLQTVQTLTLLDGFAGKPIANVRVTVTAGNNRLELKTDRNGRLSIKLPAGEIEVSAPGYEPAVIDTSSLDSTKAYGLTPIQPAGKSVTKAAGKKK